MKTLLKFNLALLAFFSITYYANYQTGYQYLGKSKMNGVTMITLSNGSDSIVFTEGIQHIDKIVRQVYTKNGNFVFRYNNLTRVDNIYNTTSEIVGTTKGFYDITLLDGKLYDHKALGVQWEYLQYNRKVLHGSYYKNKDGSFVDTSFSESISPEEEDLLKAMSIIYGYDVINRKANQPLRIMLAIISGLILALSHS
jgi:hypothetical protein